MANVWEPLSDGTGFPDYVSAISLDQQNNLLVDIGRSIYRYDGPDMAASG